MHGNRWLIGLWVVACLASPAVALATDYGFTTIDVPGAAQTQAFGVNGTGNIVGVYVDAPSRTRGFHVLGGSFTTIDVPSPTTTLTAAFGINDSGDIVGRYLIHSGEYGFRDGGGTFTAIVAPFPATSSTNAFGISSSGAVVGCRTQRSLSGVFHLVGNELRRRPSPMGLR
jgi:uncharacterized membrane protein